MDGMNSAQIAALPLLARMDAPRREAFISDLLTLLAERTGRYTMGDASSVRVETAETLLGGIAYCIALHLRLHPSEGADQSVRALYEAGVQDARRLMQRGRLLLRQAETARPPLENLAFAETLAALPEFSRRYDVEFLAHELPCSIDYPLARPVPETLQGVEFLNAYLRQLLAETAFLRRFQPEPLRLLYERYYGDWYGLLVGLYGPVAEGAIGCVLCGSPPERLLLAKQERTDVCARLAALPEADALIALRCAAQTVCTRLAITGAQERDTLFDTANALLPRIRAAAGRTDASGIFATAPDCR